MKRIILLAGICATTGFGQTAAGDDAALKTEVHHLMDLLHIDEIMTQQLKAVMPPMIAMMKQNPAVTPEMADEFGRRFEKELVSNHEFSDMVADAYAKRFTLAEVKELEKFYGTPTGKKLVQEQPQLMAEMQQKGGAFGQAMAMRLINEIVKDHPEYMRKAESATPAVPPPPPPPPPAPKAALTPTNRMRVGGEHAEALLINKVQPAYPIEAKKARVQGKVILDTFIARDGTVEDLKLMSGDPMLVDSAMTAVRQWVYKPTLLNGDPVPIETTVTVNYTLVQ